MTRVAVIQKPPKLLDRGQTVREAVAAVREAAHEGAKLVVFPEAFIPGYPTWIWRLRAGTDSGLLEQLHAQLLAHSVDLRSGDLLPLSMAAKEHKVTIVCGINERDSEFSRATLYNTVVTIGPEGHVLNRHRKLMPTYPERTIWGFGDATGLRVIDTACGRLGALICWENLMPLARTALYAEGIEIYVAPTYDCGARSVATFQHIAREGGCWVIASGFALRASDVPDTLPGKTQMYPDPDEWINLGDSVIVDPRGNIVAGPLRREYGILYGDIDVAEVANAKRMLDVVGHYARPDVFQLRVNRDPQPPVEFVDPEKPDYL